MKAPRGVNNEARSGNFPQQSSFHAFLYFSLKKLAQLVNNFISSVEFAFIVPVSKTLQEMFSLEKVSSNERFKLALNSDEAKTV